MIPEKSAPTEAARVNNFRREEPQIRWQHARLRKQIHDAIGNANVPMNDRALTWNLGIILGVPVFASKGLPPTQQDPPDAQYTRFRNEVLDVLAQAGVTFAEDPPHKNLMRAVRRALERKRNEKK